MRRVRGGGLRLEEMVGRCLFNEEGYVKAWRYGRQM
jgi:hypothetical protein